jgi:molybdate transport system regulatory protein
MTNGSPLKLKLQIFCGSEIAMGPGKADLLDSIAASGSISAAAKAMGMSYRRAWLLVDVMNRCWNGALVEAVAGGSHERGARVTPLGHEVLRQYRALQKTVDGQADAGFGEQLATFLSAVPRLSQH